MQRTLTALYETQAEAERVRDALNGAGLGGDVDIHDQEADQARGQRGLGGWLSDLFGGHKDSHLYAEGLRHGHVLLTVKVEELNETRAAEIMDAGPAVDLVAAEETWRAEGWKPETGHPHHSHISPPDLGGDSSSPYSAPAGGIRGYTL